MRAVCFQTFPMMEFVKIFEPGTLTRIRSYKIGFGRIARRFNLKKFIFDFYNPSVLNKFLCFANCVRTQIIESRPYNRLQD